MARVSNLIGFAFLITPAWITSIRCSSIATIIILLYLSFRAAMWASGAVLDSLSPAGPLNFNEGAQGQRRWQKYDSVLAAYMFLWTVLTLLSSTGSCVGLIVLLRTLGAFYGKGVKNGFCSEWLWSYEAGVKIEGILNGTPFFLSSLLCPFGQLPCLCI